MFLEIVYVATSEIVHCKVWERFCNTWTFLCSSKEPIRAGEILKKTKKTTVYRTSGKVEKRHNMN